MTEQPSPLIPNTWGTPEDDNAEPADANVDHAAGVDLTEKDD